MREPLHSQVSGSARDIALLIVAIALLVNRQAAAIGTWTNVIQSAPGNNGIERILLLSDGSVMAQQVGTSSNWYRLTPDTTGSYVNGTWGTLAPMNYTRQFYASDVLPDGRVFVAGGEIVAASPGGNTAEVYDPAHNSWTVIPVPPGLICTNCGSPGFSDCGSVVLANGNVMIAPVLPASPNATVIFNSKLNTLSQGPAYFQSQNEATWVKLPDDSILTIDATQNSNLLNSSERYIPSLNEWINDATLAVPMFNSAQETGPGVLLPDGRAFFIGGLGHTAYYTPSGNTNAGSSTPGPDLPTGVGWDDPCAVMFNGKVLIQTTCSPGTSYCYYEMDPTSNYPVGAMSSAGNWGAIDTSGVSHTLLNLPDGTILLSRGTSTLEIYVPDGSPVALVKPTITSISANSDGSFHLTGAKINGFSQGSSFGDDCQNDNNYPIVRMTNSATGIVCYARTYNWSSTGVQTGAAQVTTEFSLPTYVLANPGTYSLVAIANGISSDPVSFTYTGPTWVDFNTFGSTGLGTYDFPYATLAEGVSGVPVGGTIAINAAVQPSLSSETLTISKLMTIISVSGPSTIGN